MEPLLSSKSTYHHLAFKRVLLLILMLFFYSISFAQDYQRITKRIDSLANIGLPKSALEETDRLDLLARKNNNASQQIKAVMYRMLFQSYIKENALVEIIDRLKLDIAKADYPVKPVLQSLLAGMYSNYYYQNRWQVGQRSHLEKPGSDFTQWNIQTIIDESTRLYKVSLQDYNREQHTPVGILDGALKGDTTTRYLRPTLYDLLVQRALVFFLTEETALTKPKQPFALNDPGLFGDGRVFVGLTINTIDTASTFYQGIKYLQQATLFHLQKQDEEALADLDLKRLEFLYSHASVTNKNVLYLNALEKLYIEFSEKPICTDALVLEGKYYQSTGDLKKAYDYFSKAIYTYPKSFGAENAKGYLRLIQQKKLSATVEDVNIPDKPLLGLLNYNNIKTAHITIYKVSATQYNELAAIPSDINRFTNQQNIYPSDSVFRYLKKLQPIKNEPLKLPDLQDYRMHSAEFKIDPLKSGHYILIVKDEESDDPALIQLTTFKVCNLSYVIRRNTDHQIEVIVMNRETGAPVHHVEVTLAETNKKETDANGICLFDMPNQYNISVKLTTSIDTLYVGSHYIYGAFPQKSIRTNTILFTDRQIYRPGQTVYYKGLQVQTDNGKSNILTNEKITVTIKDGNQKAISSIPVVTNEFGTFGGSFIIPQNILNGWIFINTPNGEKNIRVEEYKRPGFHVDFLPITKKYAPNDSVTVDGIITAYSGYGISQGRIAYNIIRRSGMRSSQYQYQYQTQTEIIRDTIKADENGKFKIKFKAVADTADNSMNANYTYLINADITDGSGETHSANTQLIVGKNNFAICANFPQKITAADSLVAKINNLNGGMESGNMQFKVYSLNEPGRLFKNRIWSKPDQFLLTKDEYKKDYSEYAYGNEDDKDTWGIKNKLIDLTLNTDSKRAATFKLNGLNGQPTGTYKIIINAKNGQGDSASYTQYVYLLNEPGKPQTFNTWVMPLITTVEPGGHAAFLVGNGKAGKVLIEKYLGSKIGSSQWLNIANGKQRLIKVPVNADEKNVSVQFLMVYQNRVYTNYQTIVNQEGGKKLDIKFLTFRNILQPGEKEQWKLQVSQKNNEQQAAEMVAGLYDASLDNIQSPEDWNGIFNAINHNYNQRYFNWISNNFVNSNVSVPLKYSNYYFNAASRRYELLNLFDYNYYGGYNSGYAFYLRKLQLQTRIEDANKQLNAEYLRTAALVKNGYDISGKVTDERGISLPGVNITIGGTSIKTSTNVQGNYKIKVPANATLTFSFIGYQSQEKVIGKSQEIVVTMKTDPNHDLSEVTIQGLVISREEKSLGYATDNIMIDEPVGSSRVVLHGSNSITDKNQPLWVVDGIISNGSDAGLNPDDIESIKVLKGPDAIALYGAQAENGAMIVTTKKHNTGSIIQQPIVIRKNFNETAFFYPQLHTNEKGEILIDFTIPEALTKWRFQGFAHTKDLKTGYIETEIVTQKQLSITTNMPRFLREGDTLTVSARLANLTASALKGKVILQLFNALNMQPVSILVNPADARQNFEVAASANKPVSFRIIIPAGLDALTYRITADAGQFSDGEENTVPVLPNRMLVTESMPMMVRPGQTRSFTFDKLVNQHSPTLKNKTLTFEYTQNPAWYAVQALPYMMEFPYECSEQIFSRYYANSLSANLINKMPAIKQVFEQWKNVDSPELLSNLEKNPELKATLVEETPWLRDAVNESEQKKCIALLFDLNKMSYELQMNLDKLQKKQLPDGGFPWFGGDRSDPYITRHILAGIGQLYSSGAVDLKNETLKVIADKAMGYLDNYLINEANRAKKQQTYESRILWSAEIHAYYVQSYYTARSIPAEMQPLLANYLKLAEDQWKFKGVYEQAMIALTMQRDGKPEVARQIIRSLMETAQHTDDMGMYWAKNRSGYYWYESPVETQSLMIELFTEAGNNDKAIEEMKIWLLRNKQTNNWQTTKATAAACYALLLKGDNWLADTGHSEIRLNGKSLADLKPQIRIDAGTGYIKTNWADEQVEPAFGKVAISNKGKTISWGALHWQYLENLDKITLSQTDIKLDRRYFIMKQTGTGPVLIAVDAAHQPKTGDLLKVVVYLKAGRDFQYVQLKDMRPAGTEPVDVLSNYKYQDGLFYYQVTKDVATNFFISELNKGNYVFEYSLRVAQPGNFSTGISTVQCMYAPEFNAHSEGNRMIIKP